MIRTQRAPRPKRDARQLTTRLIIRAGPDAVATSLCTERSKRFSRGKRLAIEDENTHPIVPKNRDRGHKYEL